MKPHSMARCREATLFLRLGPWDLIVARCPALIPRRGMRSSFRTVNGKRTSCVILATAIAASCSRAIHDWNLTRRAGCCDVASRSGETRQAASLHNIYLCARFLFDLFLHLRPGIFQRHGAVKHWTSGFGIPVDAKIPEAFELITACNGRIPKRWLQLSLRDHFQRVRI